MGFEPGSTEKSAIVETFLRERAERSAKLPEQVHAIWYRLSHFFAIESHY